VLKFYLKKNSVSLFQKWLLGTVLVVIVIAVSGCHTIGFYGQAIKGQYQIFAHQESIEDLSAQPSTPAPLKQRFALLADLRSFAKDELKLPTDSHYKKYVDLHRPFVVWNVEAAPEFSMEPKTWWYPMLGSLKYRGYFSKAGATNYAADLRAEGYDVSVGGVGAYSTLGWFKDPVLNTFIFEEDAELAEIIFHELGHQRLFARGDTDFNEAFATTVGQEGARRWLTARKNQVGLTQYLAHLHHSDQFVHLVMATRARLQTLYGDQVMPDGKIKAGTRQTAGSPENLRLRKREILDGMKEQFAQLKSQWHGDSDYEGWFKHPINNAHLNSVAEYYDFVPAFEQLLAANGGDMERFYRAAEQLSRKPITERHEELRALAKTRTTSVRAQRLQNPAQPGPA
jgi:predicted aminopeptidase